MNKTILFVDDEVPILNALKRVFRKSPHKTLFTADVVEALELVRTKSVSVLVSDYSMPTMTGAELLAEAKKIKPDMTRIILSGNNDQEATIQAINKGAASRFLTKPWNDRNLVSEIEIALAMWEAQQYTNANKQLFTQSAFYNLVNDEISNDATNNAAIVYFGISALDNVKRSKGLENLEDMLISLVPARSDNNDAVKLALMDDQNFCAYIKQNEEDVDLCTQMDEFIGVFEQHYEHDGQVHNIDWKAGYVLVNSNASPCSSLLEYAMAAYQRSISASNNGIVQYEQWMFEQDSKHRQYISHLSNALEKNEFL